MDTIRRKSMEKTSRLSTYSSMAIFGSVLFWIGGLALFTWAWLVLSIVAIILGFREYSKNGGKKCIIMHYLSPSCCLF